MLIQNEHGFYFLMLCYVQVVSLGLTCKFLSRMMVQLQLIWKRLNSLLLSRCLFKKKNFICDELYAYTALASCFLYTGTQRKPQGGGATASGKDTKKRDQDDCTVDSSSAEAPTTTEN